MELLDIRIIDVIDIVLVAFLLYYIYKLIKGTVAINIFIGIVIIYAIWKVTELLEMEMLSKILGGFLGVGMVALVVVFQQEIRRFLLLIGKNAVSKKNSFWRKVLVTNTANDEFATYYIQKVIDACKSMSMSKTGALIVFAKTYEEQVFNNNGEVIDARISKRLLEAIFAKTSPIHDGAVVISEGLIRVASCILPLTENSEIPAQLGLRHRAAVGITEQSDAIAIIVSEETGFISYASRGKVRTNISLQELDRLLNKDVA